MANNPETICCLKLVQGSCKTVQKIAVLCQESSTVISPKPSLGSGTARPRAFMHAGKSPKSHSLKQTAEAIALRLEAIATRLEAVATRLEALLDSTIVPLN